VNLLDFDTATKDALSHLHPLKIERVWEDGEGRVKALKHEGFFIDYRKVKVDAEPEKIFNIIQKLADQFDPQRFVVDVIKPNRLLLLRSQLKTPGQGWIEWQVGPTYVTQTVFFAPRGLAGFAYWYLLYPFHALIFHWLIKNIARNSVVK
jgi:hypothetical protein